jgi:hypothetical protein
MAVGMSLRTGCFSRRAISQILNESRISVGEKQSVDFHGSKESLNPIAAPEGLPIQGPVEADGNYVYSFAYVNTVCFNPTGFSEPFSRFINGQFRFMSLRAGCFSPARQSSNCRGNYLPVENWTIRIEDCFGRKKTSSLAMT